MKKKLISILALVLCFALLAVSLVGCGDRKDPEASPEYNNNHTQGVKVVDGKTVVTVGNTAATSGAYAGVGVPFNYALEAYLWNYATNVNTKYQFEFKHYDDEFDGSKGLTFTQKLVEQDEVFALVGHFGTNTVQATADYIIEYGVPMVYAATGVKELYNPAAEGNERAMMPVQPIYNTEGRSLVATAVAPTKDGMGLAAQKLGVISTTDDAGASILAGIKEEVALLGIKNVEYQTADATTGTDYSAQVNALKAKGCDVVIIAANQGPFSAIASQFLASNYDNVDIITSYVSANGATMGALATAGVITDTRQVYAGAWLDIIDAAGTANFSADYWAFTAVLTAYGAATNTAEEAAGYLANSFAMAGHLAGAFFCEGLERVSDAGKELTWQSYVDAMESTPITIPMTKGVQVDLADGSRIGIPALSLVKYDVATAAAGGTAVRPLTDLADIEAAYKAK